MNPDTWLAANTYHHSDFRDIDALVREKQRQALSISLCLPTLNEEATIGKEVVIFHSELVTRHPLLDEIVVIDSGSSDHTCDVARANGATVCRAQDILPECGHKRGKGENLWKALYQLSGDIIVYVDADIRNIRSRFVYALVGPLLLRPEVQYVKAFYDRPLVMSGGIRPSGGGRVTEILVRPLFSLFFPELAALIQPLSGEYAARRSVLEQLAFPVGYGVETAHLIDVYKRWGMAALAQTDLDRRVHYNQPVHELGKMSFGILRVFLQRLEDYGVLYDAPPLTTVLRQFECHSHVYRAAEHEIVEEERPPMMEVVAYRKKRGLPLAASGAEDGPT